MVRILIVLVYALALAAGASAATGPTLVVPASHVGDAFAASGCGYKPGHDIFLYLYRSGDPTELVGVATHDDAQGCFSVTTGYTFTTAGDYEAYTYQVKPNLGPGAYNQNHPAADTDFAVT